MIWKEIIYGLNKEEPIGRITGDLMDGTNIKVSNLMDTGCSKPI